MNTAVEQYATNKTTELPNPNFTDMVYLDAFLTFRELHLEKTEPQIHRLVHKALKPLLAAINCDYMDDTSLYGPGSKEAAEDIAHFDRNKIEALETGAVPGKEILQSILGLPRPTPCRGPYHPCYVAPISARDASFRTSTEVYNLAVEIVSSFHKDGNLMDLLLVRVRYVMADHNSALNSLNYLHYNCGHTAHGIVDPSRQWLAHFVEDTRNPMGQGLFELLRKPSHTASRDCSCRLCSPEFSSDDQESNTLEMPTTDKAHPCETMEHFRWRVCNPCIQLTKLELSAVCLFRFGYEIVLYEINDVGKLVAWSPSFKMYNRSVAPPSAGRVFIAYVAGHYSPIVLCNQLKPPVEVRIFPTKFESVCFHSSVHLECIRLLDYSKFLTSTKKCADRLDGMHCRRNIYVTLEKRGDNTIDLDTFLPPIRIEHHNPGFVKALPSFATSTIDQDVRVINFVQPSTCASPLPAVCYYIQLFPIEINPLHFTMFIILYSFCSLGLPTRHSTK